MAEKDRLRRYLCDQLDHCQDDDVEQRLEELMAMGESVSEISGEDAELLSALSNETRYKIIRLLHVADRELCVCELSPVLDVSDGAISHALSKLFDADLVERQKEGKWRRYTTTNRATALLVALDGSRNV